MGILQRCIYYGMAISATSSAGNFLLHQIKHSVLDDSALTYTKLVDALYGVGG